MSFSPEKGDENVLGEAEGYLFSRTNFKGLSN
jgi:hypothetical protein